MKAAEIKVGGLYVAKVNNQLTTVMVDSISESYDGKARYNVTNTKTGRSTTFRSAAKFRDAVDTTPQRIHASPQAVANRAKEDEQSANPTTKTGNGTGLVQNSETPATTTNSTSNGVCPTNTYRKNFYRDDGRCWCQSCVAARRSQGHTLKDEMEVTKANAAFKAATTAQALPVAGAPNLIIRARAGTGKTTTLVEGLKCVMRHQAPTIKPSPQQDAVWKALCEGPQPRTVCMVAFNKSIATELKERVPHGVDAMTMHSMGFKAVNKQFRGLRVEANRVDEIIADIYRVNPRDLRREKPGLMRATADLVGLCKMNLTDMESDGLHDRLDQLVGYYNIEMENWTREVYELVPQVIARCKDVTRDKCLDFNDMVWLPVVLNIPVFKYDLLLVDECVPGWTPVMLADGRSTTIKEIVESDEEFRVRAYDTTKGVGKNCRVIGKQKLLNQKPLVKIRAKHLHKTGTNRKSNFVICTVDHKVWTINRGWVPAGEVRVGDDVIIETAAKTTQKGKITKQGRDHLAKLQTGNTRGLGNPGGSKEQFNRIKGGNGRGPTLAEQTLIDALNSAYAEGTWQWSYVVKTGDAPQFGMGSRPSHYKIDIANENERIAIEVDGYSHRGQEATDTKKEEFLDDLGWKVIRVTNREAIQKTAEVVDFVLGVSNTACEGYNCPRPAKVVSVDPVEIPDNYVYDITVEDCHNFYANGVLVHNCQDLNRCQQALAKMAGRRVVLCGDDRQAIYGFAGADCDSLPRMEQELQPCVVLPLTVTRRCGHAIVDEAKKLVPDFEAHEGNPAGVIRNAKYPTQQLHGERVELPVEQTYLATVGDGDMVLCRVNAPLVSQCFRLLRMGRKATIQGRDIGQGLISTIKKLKANNVVEARGKLDDWHAQETRKENAKRNPSEARLIALQDRVDCLLCFMEGCTTIDEVVRKVEAIFTDNRETPGVKLSSIHKAKGLEAKRVYLLRPKGAGCPHPMAKTEWQRKQEQNLLYVAVTRAIEELVYVN